MKQRSKKSLKIIDAVVRGGKNAYEFEVFPIETEFEPQSAVYIFSRRKIDKTGRGHQKFVCIGQTASLDGDFSEYKKNFASKRKANVICVYVEDDEISRLKIEEELKAAHIISDSDDSENEPVKVKTAKISKTKSKEILQSKRQVSNQKMLSANSAKLPKSNAKQPKKMKVESLPVKPKVSKSKVQKPSPKPANLKEKTKTEKSNGKVLKTKSGNGNPKRTKTKPASNGKKMKGNGKAETVNNRKSGNKKQTPKRKNGTSKSTERKQLAF